MTIPTRQGTSPHRRGGYVWAVLAVLTCPCHLPIWVVLLAGSAAGAFLAEHFATTLMVFSVLFILSLGTAVRILRGKQSDDD